MAWEAADLEDARRTLDKDIFAVVEFACNERQFVLRKQGHAYALYCPCGQQVVPGAEPHRLPFIRVDGTPKNPTWKAKKLRRVIDHCPDRHQLMRMQ